MKRLTKGILVGAGAGVIDVLPMIAQRLSADADWSAFCFWVVTGAMVATSTLEFQPVVKGIVIAYALLVPLAILIGWNHPATLIPIAAMTLLLGAGVGWMLGKR